MNSACFLNENNEIFIITSNANISECEGIKVFNLNGYKIKEIDNSNDETYFINYYYDNKFVKNYIITGNFGFVKSYEYNNNKIYHKYNDHDKIKFNHYDILINKTDLIESCEDGAIRIWNFHSGALLKKVNLNKSLYGICLWNNEYLFVGCYNEPIQIIYLNNEIIIENLKVNNGSELNIKKIIHPYYGECLLSQGFGEKKIKLWINKK